MTIREKGLIREIRVYLWLRCLSQRARERSIRLFIQRFIVLHLPKSLMFFVR